MGLPTNHPGRALGAGYGAGVTLVLYALVAVAVAWYLRGVTRLRARHHDWKPVRTASFVGGAAVLAAAVSVPDETFTGHMIGHIGLGMVGPLLLSLGAPVTLGLQTAAEPYRSRLRRFVQWRVTGWVLHPVVGWLLFGGTIAALYLTGLLAEAGHHEWFHVLMHVHLVVVGCLFLWPLVGADPVPHRLPYGGRLVAVLLAVPFHAFVGLALLSATTPVAAPIYDSLSDQRRAASLLWISGELMSVVLAGLVFREWLAADRRQAGRFDRRAAVGP